jgi:hypothetical protein
VRKLLTYMLALSVLLIAGVFGAQFLPSVLHAKSVVAAYEAARAAADSELVTRLSAQPQIDRFEAARIHALNSDKAVVSALSYADRSAIWSIRAAVLDGRLEPAGVNQLSGAGFHAAMLTANAKLAGRAIVPASIPLLGVPAGSGITWVWIGPVGYSPALTLPFSVFNGLKVAVVTEAGQLKVDMSELLQKSARENAYYLTNPDGTVNAQMMKVISGYSGDAENLWIPIAASSTGAD